MSSAANKAKRSRKVPPKFKESLVQPKSTTIPEKTKWFTLLCLEDNKQYVSNVKSMETLDGLEVSQDEVQVGDTFVWHYRGAPYKAEIISIHDKKPMPNDNNKQANKRRYSEDSSDESDDNSPPQKKTACTEEQSRSPVTLSDTDRLSSLSGKISAMSNGHSPSPVISSQNAQPANPASQKTPRRGLPSDGFSQKLIKIEECLVKLEEKMDKVLQHVVSNSLSPSVKMEGAGHCQSPLNTQQLPVDEERFITEAGVNLLTLRASNPAKYALSLLDALFTDEEMGQSCYSKTSRSVKPPLPSDKIALLEECIDYKFGRGTTNANREDIAKRCNQKCLDRGNPNKRMKKIKCAENKEN